MCRHQSEGEFRGSDNFIAGVSVFGGFRDSSCVKHHPLGKYGCTVWSGYTLYVGLRTSRVPQQLIFFCHPQREANSIRPQNGCRLTVFLHNRIFYPISVAQGGGGIDRFIRPSRYVCPVNHHLFTKSLDCWLPFFVRTTIGCRRNE